MLIDIEGILYAHGTHSLKSWNGLQTRGVHLELRLGTT